MSENPDDLLLTTSGVADLLGIHPSTVKRWSDDGTLATKRTGGGHRRFHLRQVLTTAREGGIPTYLDPFSPWEANVWLAVGAAAAGDFRRLIGLALAWLSAGNTELLGRLFFEAGRRDDIPLSRFLDDGVRGFMSTVGEEWRNGRLQVGEEHLATQVILEALMRLRIHMESASVPSQGPVDPRPVAIVGAMEGDHHDLGAQAVRAVLELEGWKVYYLGPNVPVEEFAAVQRAQMASLVCISFSPGNTLPDLQRAVTVLGEFYRPTAPYALALGGTMVDIVPEFIDSEVFEDVSFSRSAADFQTWLRTRSRAESSGQPVGVA
jgi:excisionase family DNA binding protein